MDNLKRLIGWIVAGAALLGNAMDASACTSGSTRNCGTGCTQECVDESPPYRGTCDCLGGGEPPQVYRTADWVAYAPFVRTEGEIT